MQKVITVYSPYELQNLDFDIEALFSQLNPRSVTRGWIEFLQSSIDMFRSCIEDDNSDLSDYELCMDTIHHIVRSFTEVESRSSKITNRGDLIKFFKLISVYDPESGTLSNHILHFADIIQQIVNLLKEYYIII